MAAQSDRTLRIPPSQVQEVAKALSGDLRLRILEALGGGQALSVNQLMERLGVAQPTVSINVQLLEQAGLVTTAQGANREKLCSRAHDTVVLELPRAAGESLRELEEISMPVGLYTDCSVQPTCGLVGREGVIGCADDPRSFFLPERTEAELLWFSGTGYVEYRFPNPVPQEIELQGLRISAELCSEAMGFNEEWPSDITLYVNDRRIGTATPSGDYGGQRGELTPAWWMYGTQYGNLYEWSIGGEGSFLNGDRVSGIRVVDLGLDYNKPITVRFEVEEGAANPRGMNLFGSRFGRYEQSVKLVFVK